MAQLIDRVVHLEDRYEKHDGEVQLSGLQALVRIPLEQARLDRARGSLTATLISGYEGSPLAGYDLELARNERRLTENGVLLLPALNEELGANAVQGSQLASASSDKNVDGVIGIWYGKAPGLDRATDALRHGNLGGADPKGGVLVLVGDDSIAKSSTVPSSSEAALVELGMPVLSPGDPEDVLRLGLHGIALSRFSGLWTGLKLATNVVDGGGTVALSSLEFMPVEPDNMFAGKPYVHAVSAHFLGPNLAALEASQVNERLELARRYARANALNEIHGDRNARIGVVAAGATYLDAIEALRSLGFAPENLESSGIRVLRLGMISPLEPDIVDTFADGLEEIVVVEEKRPVIEYALKDLLHGRAGTPLISGRRTPTGTPLLRSQADLPPEVIARALAARIGHVFDDPAVAERIGNRVPEPRKRTLLPLVTRTPYFCSGCPHNRSTEVPEGSLVGAGIGCSALAVYTPEERSGDVIGLTQMGGEGGMWIGMGPFVNQNHLFQNIGDGTFHHSGSLAVRAAVAAGAHMTFKLLYNDTVAMTGGQDAVGKMAVPQLTRALLAEGVAKVVVTTDEPKKYRRVRLPRGVAVRHRDALVQVQEELAAIDGVTVLIHDQECATELRRKRKRGLVADRPTRVVINERVCEGCGDCGFKSNCLSVQPVSTEYGRKTQIHQGSCNKDYSCLEGDCPSFITVKTRAAGKRKKVATSAPPTEALPDPKIVVPVDDYNLRITGIGGTGVVTIAQVIATAATSAGFFVRNLDQMGMAQKGGAVVSDIRLSTRPLQGSNKVGDAECDLYLACDVLVGAQPGNLAVTSPDRTISICGTTRTPTGAMVSDVTAGIPEVSGALREIAAASRTDVAIAVDPVAQTTTLMGEDQYANVFLLGAAVQAGALPIAPVHLENALRLNGVAVDRNLLAFALGRAHAADHAEPSARRATDTSVDSAPDLDVTLLGGLEVSDGLRSLISRRASELVRYQNRSYAETYLERLREVHVRESSALPQSEAVTAAYADSLFKLMAYKDEYEVARLSVDPEMRQRIRDEFGAGARIHFRLHPPVLRALGMKRKLALGAWFIPVFHLLRAAKIVRGTPFDVFGWARVRRVERRLPVTFHEAIMLSAAGLTATNSDLVVELAELPDMIRGYEQVKLDNVDRFEIAQRDLLARIDGMKSVVPDPSP